MRTIMCIAILILTILNIVVVSITDDKRVYKSLSKKELYRLSIFKDLFSAIIMIMLVILAFI